VDLHETAAEYVITAEVPGMQRDDLEINAHEGTLTIAGTRPEGPAACEQYHRVERGHGSFRRSFHLPSAIDETAITADLRDGVLTVRCPKVPDNGARRIHVS
jgi:HSP20 family protein